MKLHNILNNNYLYEGLISDVLQQTKPQRIKSLSYPAEILGINPIILDDEIGKNLLLYDLKEYVPDSFWDRLSKLCGTSMDPSGLFRKSFERAKSVKSSKLRYMQGYLESYDKVFNSIDFTANAELLNNIKTLTRHNIYFFDTFIYLLVTYIPGIDR